MLTRRMQVQAIRDLYAGLKIKATARDFQGPWRQCYDAIVGAKDGQQHQALITALEHERDRDFILATILAGKVEGRDAYLQFPSLEEIAVDLQPVSWLWPNWIPLGMLSLLGAVPGAGKSYLALDLTRLIISGMPFPDGTPCPRAGANCIYVDAEVIPQLINERAEAWQMNRKRLFLMLPDPNELIDFSNEKYREMLIEMAHAKAPALIVIDSLSSVSSKGENNVEDVRQVLGFLNAVANDFQCAVLIVHHLRKRGALPLLDTDLTIDDFRGSSHIIAMSRSVMGLSIVQTGPDTDRNGPRKLEVIKTNLARYPDPVGVEFVPLHPSSVFLKYTRDTPEQYKAPTEVDECAAWLLQTLTENGEPMKPKDLVELAAGEYSERMVYRARKQLGGQVVNTDGRHSPKNRWALAEWGSDTSSDDDDDSE